MEHLPNRTLLVDASPATSRVGISLTLLDEVVRLSSRIALVTEDWVGDCDLLRTFEVFVLLLLAFDRSNILP